jgi:hypothetical protein
MSSAPQGFQAGGLNAYYFKDLTPNQSWGNAAVQTLDRQINFDWGNGGAASGAVGNDNFGASWKGKIKAIATGWTNFFTTVDDGVHLKFGGQSVINKWYDQAATEHQGGIWMQADQFYDIEVAYYEHGGSASMKLAWQAPGSSKQIVSANDLFYDIGAANAAGIKPPSPTITSAPVKPMTLSAFDARFGFVMSVQDANFNTLAAGIAKTIDFDFGYASPTANAPADNFRLNGAGRMSVQRSGWYNFFTTADDSINLTIGGTALANNTTARATTTYQSGMWMNAGESYFLNLQYQDLGGTANVKIEWQGEDTGWQRRSLTERNSLTLTDRSPVNVYSGNMFAAYDQTGGDMTKLRQLYPNPLWS